jgi:CheY-like chemotaxis protein
MATIHKKILIVEDSTIQAESLRKLLEQHGLRVLCASEGKVGIELARQWSPDVIILDVKLPDMDGFEVCRRLKNNSQTNDIPIVMLTVYSELSNLRMGIYLGAVDFIPKDDFANVVLLETLRQLQVLEETKGFSWPRRSSDTTELEEPDAGV